MNQIKNNNTLKESLIIEEYKRACKEVENHETRSFRIYLLIISGFVVILGLNEQIDNDFIPYIVSLFLWITFNFAITDRRFKYFAISYLINTYDNVYPEINYENYFRNYNSHEDEKKPGIIRGIIRGIKRLWKWIQKIFHPLLFIYVFGVYVSYYFGFKETCQNIEYNYWSLPFWGLFILNLLIIGKLIVLYTHSFEKTFEIVKKIHTKNFKKENGSE